jgi:SAM-dependent methyltransferase
MSSVYRQALERWLKELDVIADRVLDVGGSQLPVIGRVKSWQVQKYQTVDLWDPHHGNAPDIAFDLNEAIQWGHEPADVVFCLEVMEYVWDPQIAIANLASMLVPGGTLHITFPYFYPPHEPYEKDCLRYTLSGAKKLLSSAAFQIESIVHRDAIGGGLSLAIHDNALRPSKTATPRELFNTLGFIITATKS